MMSEPTLSPENNQLASLGRPKTTDELPERPGKTISQSVRSGTQIYAQHQELVVIGHVNPGAECIADGNIHVYGALKGRAIAGAEGDESARIFCQSLDAELIAIAGRYLTREQFNVDNPHNKPVQVYLEQDQIKIKTL